MHLGLDLVQSLRVDLVLTILRRQVLSLLPSVSRPVVRYCNSLRIPDVNEVVTQSGKTGPSRGKPLLVLLFALPLLGFSESHVDLSWIGHDVCESGHLLVGQSQLTTGVAVDAPLSQLWLVANTDATSRSSRLLHFKRPPPVDVLGRDYLHKVRVEITYGKLGEFVQVLGEVGLWNLSLELGVPVRVVYLWRGVFHDDVQVGIESLALSRLERDGIPWNDLRISLKRRDKQPISVVDVDDGVLWHLLLRPVDLEVIQILVFTLRRDNVGLGAHFVRQLLLVGARHAGGAFGHSNPRVVLHGNVPRLNLLYRVVVINVVPNRLVVDDVLELLTLYNVWRVAVVLINSNSFGQRARTQGRLALFLQGTN